MDTMQFDALTRAISDVASRRALLSRVSVASLGAAFARLGATAAEVGAAGEVTAERKKRKKRKKRRKHTPLAPLVLNEYGCVDVGRPCRGDDANCCSGVCEGTAPKQGEPDNSRCIGLNALTCADGQDSTILGNIPCGADGLCLQTTGKTEFCGRIGFCAVCQRDEDCEATKGPGAACVVNAAACANSSGGTACYMAAV